MLDASNHLFTKVVLGSGKMVYICFVGPFADYWRNYHWYEQFVRAMQDKFDVGICVASVPEEGKDVYPPSMTPQELLEFKKEFVHSAL